MTTVDTAAPIATHGGTPPIVDQGKFRRPALVIVVGYLTSSAVLIGVGMFLTRAIQHSSVLRWDTRVVRDLSMNRSSTLIHWSSRWSYVADAPTIVAVGALAAFVCATRRRWRFVIWIATVLALELGVFLTVSYTVGRDRPDVAHLGSVPSTGSFPSGHVAATITLYGTIALLLSLATAKRWARSLAWAWTLIAAAMVGWARVYRGMHHPLDVAAGALLGAAMCLVGWRAFGHTVAGRQLDPAETLEKQSLRRTERH